MARRSDHSRDELRKMTLDAACRIIASRGLDGLSIRGIAKEIGYSSGTLYQLFRNLDELIVATHILTLQDLYSELEHVEMTDDPEQTLFEIGQIYLQFARNNRHRWNALFTHSLPENSVLPEQYDAAILKLFLLGSQALKPIFPDDQSDQALLETRVLWSSLYGIVALETSSKLSRFEDVETHTRTLFRNYVAGLRAIYSKDSAT